MKLDHAFYTFLDPVSTETLHIECTVKHRSNGPATNGIPHILIVNSWFLQVKFFYFLCWQQQKKIVGPLKSVRVGFNCTSFLPTHLEWWLSYFVIGQSGTNAIWIWQVWTSLGKWVICILQDVTVEVWMVIELCPLLVIVTGYSDILWMKERSGSKSLTNIRRGHLL